jgi:hypothetical protein
VTLSDAQAPSAIFNSPQIVILSGGKPAVLCNIYGATAANVDPSGYSNVSEGVIAWSATAAGGSFAIDNGGTLLADDSDGADRGGDGAAAFNGSDIAVAGDAPPFGNSFTAFSLTTPAPASTVEMAPTTEYGFEEGTDSGQLAVAADSPSFIAVAVGGYEGRPSGCPSGTAYATGFGSQVGTESAFQTTNWASGYFTPISCDAEAPVISDGASGIGVLEDEGPGLSGAGSDGIYYRPFSITTKTFSGSPALVSDETSQTLDGADGLSVSQDSTGGIYASWTDGRGLTLAYSPNGGTSWTSPFGSELETSDPIVAGVGGGTAEVAYDSGGTEELQVVPAADTEFTP